MGFNYKIIAVDFDGTLCENKWPEIGAVNEDLIAYLHSQRRAGAKIILWTNRVGGLIFDCVNENLPEVIKEFGSDTRKIFAHEYIDDRMHNGFKLPFESASVEESGD